jgi:large subunit ribosomal protein L3
MPTRKSPRKGSLQYWPRKRAKKFLPSINWEAIDSETLLKGFIGYKAGMVSCAVKDNTPNSLTKGKEKVVPATIIECPSMKILSVRFYKNGIVKTEILNPRLDRELKRKLKVPKDYKKKIEDVKTKEYGDVRIICYSFTKKIGLKKTPDIIEIGLKGTFEEKLNFVKENLSKEILVSNIFKEGELLDIRGLTKGKGFVGPVKRFGIQLKVSKAEKGRRRPGSLGPWHPARVIFRVPMAGQLGMFTRAIYNNKILKIGKSEESLKGIKNYGNTKREYLIVQGSVQGSAKRQLVLTKPLRSTKKQKKKEYEFLELR